MLFLYYLLSFAHCGVYFLNSFGHKVCAFCKNYQEVKIFSAFESRQALLLVCGF